MQLHVRSTVVGALLGLVAVARVCAVLYNNWEKQSEGADKADKADKATQDNGGSDSGRGRDCGRRKIVSC
jgi:hypothetical protein